MTFASSNQVNSRWGVSRRIQDKSRSHNCTGVGSGKAPSRMSLRGGVGDGQTRIWPASVGSGTLQEGFTLTLIRRYTRVGLDRRAITSKRVSPLVAAAESGH